jgi:hypothetical protein
MSALPTHPSTLGERLLDDELAKIIVAAPSLPPAARTHVMAVLDAIVREDDCDHRLTAAAARLRAALARP